MPPVSACAICIAVRALSAFGQIRLRPASRSRFLEPSKHPLTGWQIRLRPAANSRVGTQWRRDISTAEIIVILAGSGPDRGLSRTVFLSRSIAQHTHTHTHLLWRVGSSTEMVIHMSCSESRPTNQTTKQPTNHLSLKRAPSKHKEAQLRKFGIFKAQMGISRVHTPGPHPLRVGDVQAVEA